jgi:hypothetical protein
MPADDRRYDDVSRGADELHGLRRLRSQDRTNADRMQRTEQLPLACVEITLFRGKAGFDLASESMLEPEAALERALTSRHVARERFRLLEHGESYDIRASQ